MIPVSHRFRGCESVKACSGALVTYCPVTRLPQRRRGSVDSSLVSESLWAWALIQIRLIVRDDVRRLEKSWTRSCHRPDGNSYPNHAYGCERIPESVSLRGITISRARYTLMIRIKIARGKPGSYPPGAGLRANSIIT